MQITKTVKKTKNNPGRIGSIIGEYLPMFVCGVLLVTFGLIYKQEFIKLLPTLVSLVVMLLHSRVNRFAFLLGGFNSVLYSIGFFMERLYPSAVSALAISFPISIVSFILWSKNRTKSNDVKVRRLNLCSGAALILLSVAFWVVSFYVYRALGTKSLILDNTLFVLGIIVTIMQMFRFVESPFLNLVLSLVNIVQWTVLSLEDVANVNYLIYNAYSFYCITKSLFGWIRLYREQKGENLT